MRSIHDLGWLVANPHGWSDLPTKDYEFLHYNHLLGFHGYLVSQLHQLGQEERLRLFAILHTHGWPVHLQTDESARFQIRPGSPWAPVDDAALIIVRDAALPFDVIANVFFEGRSEAECQARHEYLVNSGIRQKVRDDLCKKSPQTQPSEPFPSYDDSNFNKENEPQGHRQAAQAREDVVSNRSPSFNAQVPDTPTPINKQITSQSRERLAKLLEGTDGSELSSARSSFSDFKHHPDSPAPANSPPAVLVKMDEKVLQDRVNEVSTTPQAAATSGTPQAAGTSRNNISGYMAKAVWTPQDIKMLQDGVANGMNSQEIRKAYFPSRTVGAIDTKISKSKRSGISFNAGTRWTDKNRQDLIRLVEEGHSWEDISTNHFPEKTPEQCQDYHRCIAMKEDRKARAVEDFTAEIKKVKMDLSATESGMDREGSVQSFTSAAPPVQPTDAFPPNNNQAKFQSTSGNETMDELEAARDNAIDLLLPNANEDTKAWLKSALDNSSWPSCLSSLEAYRAPVSHARSKWSTEDSTALQCIRQLPEQPTNKACAVAFFPSRTAEGVRTHGHTLGRRSARARGRPSQVEEDDQEPDDLSLV